MAKSQETFNKKEKEKLRIKKRQDKLLKKEERKSNSETKSFDDMIAYVDENGMISDTPPDITKKRKINSSLIEVSTPKQEDIKTVINEGVVDYYNTDKGFGFIKDKNSIDKFFFHVNGLIDQVTEKDKVTFELERGQKGMVCVNVKKIA
jgi:cold shock CspA family protein